MGHEHLLESAGLRAGLEPSLQKNWLGCVQVFLDDVQGPGLSVDEREPRASLLSVTQAGCPGKTRPCGGTGRSWRCQTSSLRSQCWRTWGVSHLGEVGLARPGT